MNRLRILILGVLIIPAFSTVFAQRFEAGVLGGFNASQVNGDTYTGYYKPGLLGGLYVRTDLAPAVFAGFELKYSQKGARNKITPKDPDPKKYIMRLDYIDIPVFIGFRSSDRISVIGGLSAGYLMKGAEYNEYGMFPPEDQVKFKSIDLQAFGGFQFDLLDRLMLDLRIAYSVVPIRGQPGETYWYWLDNQFNNVISLAIYYRFNRRY